MAALIERDHETGRLHDAISEAKAGRGTTIVIEGVPGIGKTALLDAAREIAASADLRVFSARAIELERGLGFAVVRDVFEPALREWPADEREAVLGGAARLAAGPLGLPDADATPVEPGPAIHGLYWLTANLADRGPMLLAVDDLHWADEPSLLFLTYLARRVAELPVVVCVATRPAEHEASSRILIALGAEAGEVLRPRVLSDRGVTRLVGEMLSARAAPEFSAACMQASGGNPFLLVEAVAALRDEGVVPTASEVARIDDLRPDTITRSLLARISRVGLAADRVASAVAVLGGDLELRHVAELADLSHEATSEAIAGLRREGIFATGDRLAFIHPLVQTAVYEDIPTSERALAHLRAARMLDAEGMTDRVASHLLTGEPLGDPWVVDRLRTAAAAALSSGTPASAAAMLIRALAEPAADGERPSLRLDLGRALARDGHLDAAARAMQQAFDEVEDPVGRAGIALELGRVHRLAGRSVDAVTVLDQAIRALPAGHHDEETSLEGEIAFASHMGLPVKGWIDRFAAVAEHADGPSLPDRLVRSFYSYVIATTGTGTAEEVARWARSGVTPPDDGDPPFMLQVAAAGLAMSGAPGDALVLLDRAIETTRRMGDAVQYGFVSLTRGWMAYRAGRIRELEADARAGLPVALDGFLDLGWAASGVAHALVERGFLDEAAKLLDEHGLATTREADTAPAMTLYCVRGRLNRLLGRQRDSIADLEKCRDIAMKIDLPSPAFVEWRTDLAAAYLAAGKREHARDVAIEDMEMSRAFGAPRELGMALRSCGLVEGRSRGLELLAESVETLAGSEAQLELAKSLVEMGAALRRTGRRADAQDRLLEGLDVASQCGAQGTVARAREELRAAGARPRRERLTGPDALTASELRVARMAAEGRSNPEIAQALFVTRRTVEVHLTQCYRKLGIQSRDHLAAALDPG